MSFDISDGTFLIENLATIKTADLDDELLDFFTESNQQNNSRLYRTTLVELGMEFSFPTTVNIEINRRCLLRCQHCYITHDELVSSGNEYFDKLRTEKIENLIDELVEMGVFLIVLTGGEPFLNRNLENFIRKAASKQVIIEIFSNLQFLPEWFKTIEASQLSIGRIQTSVYSRLPDIHDNITRRQGSHARTLEDLQWLKNKGYYVEVATPLMKLNFDSRHGTEKFFRDREIHHDFSYPIMGEYYVSEKTKSTLNITSEQFAQFCDEKPDFLIKVDCSNSNNPVCAAGNALFSISANGDVFPCSQYPQKVGSVLSSPLKDIWLSAGMRNVANCKLHQIGQNPLPYNFCMGNNFSETGHPFQVPEFLQEAFAFYEKKGGEKR